MSTYAIGKLNRVPLREVWKHEAYDFTQWLEENIDVLNNVLDFDLANVDREQAAGAFSVDLVAEDAGGGTVIIENQLEKSDHDHLGKLITYLTAMGARAAIWIVSNPRPEHVAAMTWLNDSSTADFYLIKVEAVRIGDSPAAPLLTVIVEPSGDTTISEQKKELSERHDLRQKWWTRLTTHPKAKLHSHISPGYHSYLGTSSGVRGLNLNYVVNQDASASELYIDRGKDTEEENQAIFDQLYAHKDEIEQQVGLPINWHKLEGKRACRIKISMPGGYRSPEEEWEGIHTKLIDAMDKLNEALKPKLKQLKVGA